MMSVFLIVLLSAVATASALKNDIVEAIDPHNMMKITSKDVELLDELISNADTFPAPKSNLRVGKICKGDILLAKATYVLRPCRDKSVCKDICIKGNSTIGITAIRVTEIGAAQNGKVFVKAGGVGKNYVVIRMQSAIGRGYHVAAEVWGVQLNT